MNIVKGLIILLAFCRCASVFSMDANGGSRPASHTSSPEARSVLALMASNAVSEAERVGFLTIISGLKQQITHTQNTDNRGNTTNPIQSERDKGVSRTFKKITPGEILDEMGTKLVKNVIENCPLRLQFEIENIKNAAKLLSNSAFSSNPEMMETIKRNSHGILLKGEPGVGKSTIAKAIAVTTQRPCYFLCGTELGSHYANAGLKALDELFDPLIASDEPCIIIFDEIVSLTERFDNPNSPDPGLVRYFWSKFDACKQKANILIIANTNDDKRLPAPLESRFGKTSFTIPLPNRALRKQILKHHLGSIQNLDKKYIQLIVEKTEGFSARQLEDMVSGAKCLAKNRAENAMVLNSSDFIVTPNDMEISLKLEHAKRSHKNYLDRKELLKKLAPHIPSIVMACTAVASVCLGVASYRFTRTAHAQTIGLTIKHHTENILNSIWLAFTQMAHQEEMQARALGHAASLQEKALAQTAKLHDESLFMQYGLDGIADKKAYQLCCWVKDTTVDVFKWGGNKTINGIKWLWNQL